MVAILATRRSSLLLYLLVRRCDSVRCCEPKDLGLPTFHLLLALLSAYLRCIAGIRASHTSFGHPETSRCPGEDEQFHRCNDSTSYQCRASVLCVDNIHVSARWSEANLCHRIGTVYPFVCSVTATATEEIEDDTYWLTYWAGMYLQRQHPDSKMHCYLTSILAYGVLFLIMDTLETFVGWLPGFYSLVIFTTVYLMLPMFRGADKVFRKILVPLAGKPWTKRAYRA